MKDGEASIPGNKVVFQRLLSIQGLRSIVTHSKCDVEFTESGQCPRGQLSSFSTEVIHVGEKTKGGGGHPVGMLGSAILSVLVLRINSLEDCLPCSFKGRKFTCTMKIP